jgi:hypothetical protein
MEGTQAVNHIIKKPPRTYGVSRAVSINSRPQCETPKGALKFVKKSHNNNK